MNKLILTLLLILCVPLGCGKKEQVKPQANAKTTPASSPKEPAAQSKPKEPTEAEKKFLETKTKAERGDADAQFDLSGLHMEQGDNTNEVKWLKKAAAQDHNSATHNLAFAYYYGRAVEKNLQEAYKLFSKVAAKEVSGSQHMVGEMLLAGEGVKRDPEEGVRWLLKAAKSNYMFDSHARLAECHSKGIGVPKNKIKSYAWYQVSVCTGLEDLPTNVTAEMKTLKAEMTEQELAMAKNLAIELLVDVKIDDAQSQFEIGWMYANGDGLEQDFKEAAKWYQKAADQGDADAQYNLGLMYDNGQGVGQDFKEAAKWYQKAADQGDAYPQFHLGWMYANGQGVEQDFKEAFKWYQKAADQGVAMAQSNLGAMYDRGEGVEQDFKEAAKWYQKAADQGDANGQINLGVMYAKGQGVEQDFKEAFKWYQKAADQGYANGQSNLGAMYYRGRGVEQNYVTAYAWWNIAATNDHQNAKNNKSVAAKKMTPAQIAEAEELVKEMVRKNPKLLK